MRFVLLAAAALLGACATPCPPPAGAEIVATRYRCSYGQTVIAQFTRSPDQVELRQAGYPDVVLPAQPTGSGFRYQAEGTELRGRANEAWLTRPGGGELFCRSNP
jgi:hypothetical protein